MELGICRSSFNSSDQFPWNQNNIFTGKDVRKYKLWLENQYVIMEASQYNIIKFGGQLAYP